AIATFGRLHWSALAAQLNVMSLRNDYRRVADMLLMQVGTAYDQAVQAEENVTIAQANVGLKEAHLSDTRKMLAAGTVARFDLIRNQSDVNLARQQLISAQNEYDKAVAGLLTLMGVDPATPVVLAEAVPPPPPPTDKTAARQVAQQRRPELQTLNYSWQAAQANAHYYKSTLNPQVSLQANYIDENITGFTTPNQFTGTLALQVPILDGGQARAQANGAMEQAEQLRQQYEATRRSILQDVETGWDDLQSAWQRLALAEQNVRDTEQLAHIAEVRYRGGISTNLERLDAENNLDQVRSAAVSARYDYLQAQVRWMRATGQDYPSEVVDSLIMPNREQDMPLPKGMRPRDADHVVETHPPANPPAPVPPPVPPSVVSPP
ncbi:MAG TPA: TolC family protein, partial [Candidatus Xenobia bacterium]